jgi:hypothetical protein
MLHNNIRRLATYFFMLLAAPALLAQESKPQSPPFPTGVYKLDYVFSEVQNGKRVNARSYTALLHSGERGSIRLGNRLPIVTGASRESGGNQINYMDIGVNIDCRVEREVDSGIALFTSVDMSSLAPEQPGENRTGNPVVRQTKIQVDSIVPLGKQTLLSSADEVDGTSRFDFEVTATKLR